MSTSLRILVRIVVTVIAFALASPILAIGPAAGQSAPTVIVNPDPAMAGEVVTISGSGFQPGEFVWIDFAGPTLASAIADGAGSFVTSGTVEPHVPAGAHPLDASGDLGSWVTIDLTIVDPTPTAPPAPVFPDVAFLDGVQAGDLVLITGSGFQPGEFVEIHYAGDVIGVTITTFSGDFAVQALVPAHVPVGAHPLDVIGDLGSHVGTDLTVSVSAPTTTLAPTPAPTTTVAPTTTQAPMPAPTTTVPAASAQVTAQPWSADDTTTPALPLRRVDATEPEPAPAQPTEHDGNDVIVTAEGEAVEIAGPTSEPVDVVLGDGSGSALFAGLVAVALLAAWLAGVIALRERLGA